MSESASRSICYLICVYNDQQGLDRSLKSVLADAPLADILIVDDGSARPVTVPQAANEHLLDHSLSGEDPAQIIPEKINPEKINPVQIRLLRLPANKGLITALNTGIAEILQQKGYRYIARLDAGDTVNPGRLDGQLRYMEAHPEVAILGTQLRAFDAQTGKTLFHFNNPQAPDCVSRTLRLRNCLAHPSVMIRSEIFKTLGQYDPSFKHAEDYELWRRIEQKHRAANLPDIFVNKEISPDQITAKNRRGSILSRLKAQLSYFEWRNIWCWIGVARSMIALLIPRPALLRLKSGKERRPAA